MTIGSLFSGIGGLELGLERAGLGPVVFQVEIDPTCRTILQRHWPHATRFDDVTIPREYPPIDLLCGGFPCQDLSPAGRGAGLNGARSGLWREFRRIIDQLRPTTVVVENGAGARRRWLPQILADLQELGYRARAYALSAADVGAPHLRRRVFVVAHAQRQLVRHQQQRLPARRQDRVRDEGETLADALGDPVLHGRSRSQGPGEQGRSEPTAGSWWAVEPNVGRVVDGLPSRMDGRRSRIRALGNAVVPQCAEVIGQIVVEDLRIMAST